MSHCSWGSSATRTCVKHKADCAPYVVEGSTSVVHDAHVPQCLTISSSDHITWLTPWILDACLDAAARSWPAKRIVISPPSDFAAVTALRASGPTWCPLGCATTKVETCRPESCEGISSGVGAGREAYRATHAKVVRRGTHAVEACVGLRTDPSGQLCKSTPRRQHTAVQS